MSVTITRERPESGDAMQLIAELDTVLEPHYPLESRHGYSVDKLVAQKVEFFVLRVDDIAAGCGGIQLVGTEYGEIKRMYVRPRFRGRGLAKLLVRRLIDHAQAADIGMVRLETGIHQSEAIALYEHLGFYRIPPFGPYTDDPLSLCYEMSLPRQNMEGS